MNSRATAPETPRRSERVTALGRACAREGTPTNGFRGRVRARSRRAHSNDGGTDWLRDVILGGQDGLVNVLGIVLGVILLPAGPRLTDGWVQTVTGGFTDSKRSLWP
jgi:hypothetical protein